MSTVPVSEPRTREEMIARYREAQARMLRPAHAPASIVLALAPLAPSQANRKAIEVRRRARLEALVAKLKAPRYQSPRERFAAIISSIAQKHGTTAAAVYGDSRAHRLVEARREIARVLTYDHGLSSPQVGRILNLDHTSVLYLLGRTKQSRRKA